MHNGGNSRLRCRGIRLQDNGSNGERGDVSRATQPSLGIEIVGVTLFWSFPNPRRRPLLGGESMCLSRVSRWNALTLQWLSRVSRWATVTTKQWTQTGIYQAMELLIYLQVAARRYKTQHRTKHAPSVAIWAQGKVPLARWRCSGLSPFDPCRMATGCRSARL